MLNAMSAVTRAVDARIGWNRIVFAISLLIITVASVTLFRLLRDVDLDKVFMACARPRPTPSCSRGSWSPPAMTTLTFYDYFALRTIGRRHVPYRVAAMASFCSYTIGHSLGATVLTGGVVRLRVYSAWGLGVIDVAKDRFRDGADVLAGQRVRARPGRGLCPGGCRCAEPACRPGSTGPSPSSASR